METRRFIIRDCNGTVIGNPQGYEKHRIAVSIMERKKSKAMLSAWNTFYNRKDTSKCLVYSIRSETI